MYSSLYRSVRLGTLSEHRTNRGTIVQIISEAASRSPIFSMFNVCKPVFIVATAYRTTEIKITVIVTRRVSWNKIISLWVMESMNLSCPYIEWQAKLNSIPLIALNEVRVLINSFRVYPGRAPGPPDRVKRKSLKKVPYLRNLLLHQ